MTDIEGFEGGGGEATRDAPRASSVSNGGCSHRPFPDIGPPTDTERTMTKRKFAGVVITFLKFHPLPPRARLPPLLVRQSARQLRCAENSSVQDFLFRATSCDISFLMASIRMYVVSIRIHIVSMTQGRRHHDVNSEQKINEYLEIYILY